MDRRAPRLDLGRGCARRSGMKKSLKEALEKLLATPWERHIEYKMHPLNGSGPPVVTLVFDPDAAYRERRAFSYLGSSSKRKLDVRRKIEEAGQKMPGLCHC